LLYVQAKIAIHKWIKKYKNEEKIIIMYDLLRPYIKTISKLKTNELLKTCTILADLPNEYGYKKNIKGLKAIILKWHGKESLSLCKNINYFGLLTKEMSNVLAIQDNRFIVIEGFSNEKRYFTTLTNKKLNIILYTGALYIIYGLDILVKAFMEIDSPNYELWLCGCGDYVKTLQEKINIDPRIKYLGYKSHEEIAILQSESTLLVNPRQNIGNYTKYSFPSKIIEYLSTARPIISYKLDGIPNNYYNFLIAPTDNSIKSLKDTIVKVCNLPYEKRKEIGLKGREFVLQRTNPKNQINNLIKKITLK
jgi:hypothetical protein